MFKRKFFGLALITFTLTTLLSSTTCFAKEQTVPIEKDTRNYRSFQTKTDFKAVDEILKALDEQRTKKEVSPFSSPFTLTSTYGTAWPYVQVNTADPRCYGYSMGVSYTINPGDLGYYGGYFNNRELSQTNIKQYFNVNTIAQCVLADLLRATNQNSRIISSATSTIYSNERRIAIRTGLHDYNNNGIIDLDAPVTEADYHFMLQNSDGTWAEKHGASPSQSDGYINPSTFRWDLSSGYPGFYDSSTVYIAVKGM